MEIMRKTCRRCGKPYETSGRNAKDCPPCRVERRGEASTGYYRRKGCLKRDAGKNLMSPPAPILDWSEVEPAIKKGLCGRCGEKAYKADLCGRCFGKECGKTA